MPIFLARRRSSDTSTAELAKCLPLPRCWCGRCCIGLVTPHDDKVVATAASVRTVSPPPPRKTRSGLLLRLVLFWSSDNRRLAIFFCGLLSIFRCFFSHQLYTNHLFLISFLPHFYHIFTTQWKQAHTHTHHASAHTYISNIYVHTPKSVLLQRSFNKLDDRWLRSVLSVSSTDKNISGCEIRKRPRVDERERVPDVFRGT